MRYNGVWGTVCYDGFDDTDASVACRSLGLGYTYVFYTPFQKKLARMFVAPYETRFISVKFGTYCKVRRRSRRTFSIHF